MKNIVIAGINTTADGLAAMAAGEMDVTVFQNATRQGGGLSANRGAVCTG